MNEYKPINENLNKEPIIQDNEGIKYTTEETIQLLNTLEKENHTLRQQLHTKKEKEDKPTFNIIEGADEDKTEEFEELYNRFVPKDYIKRILDLNENQYKRYLKAGWEAGRIKEKHNLRKGKERVKREKEERELNT